MKLFRLHRSSLVVVLLAAVPLLWLNLSDQGWEKVLHVSPPSQLNGMMRFLWYRGWPLAPFMFSIWHGGKDHPQPGFISIPLVVDLGLALLFLTAAGFTWEQLLRWRQA